MKYFWKCSINCSYFIFIKIQNTMDCNVVVSRLARKFRDDICCIQDGVWRINRVSQSQWVTATATAGLKWHQLNLSVREIRKSVIMGNSCGKIKDYWATVGKNTFRQKEKIQSLPGVDCWWRGSWASGDRTVWRGGAQDYRELQAALHGGAGLWL